MKPINCSQKMLTKRECSRSYSILIKKKSECDLLEIIEMVFQKGVTIISP